MKVYLEQINKTNELIAGLRKKFSLVKNKGVDEEFIARLEADNKLLANYNEEIDQLKVTTKEKSSEAIRKLLEVKTRVKNAKEIIKQNFNSNSWLEFGIKDKR